MHTLRAGCIYMVGGMLLLASFAGCGLTRDKNVPPPIEYSLQTPYPMTRTLAVAPLINLSGSKDFDPLVATDTLFSELQQVAGLNVLPLNKTLAAMRALGIRVIDSPETASRIANALNADAIVVASVTAYDPYNPPSIGMTIQLYEVRDLGAAPEPIARRPDGTLASGEVKEEQPPTAKGPASQVAAVFNANNQTVLQELREFARGRTNYDSALKEERFLRDSEAYMRFVCHAMVRRLIEVERGRSSGR